MLNIENLRKYVCEEGKTEIVLKYSVGIKTVLYISFLNVYIIKKKNWTVLSGFTQYGSI